MASYFELAPQKAKPPATIEQLPQEQRQQLGRTSSLMSPAVAQILEGLADDHSDSSSDSEDDGGLSEEEEEKQPPIRHSEKDITTQKILQNKEKHNSTQAPRPSSLSPNRTTSHSKSSASKVPGKSTSSSARAAGESSDRSRNKQPHMARFHSLRSILFQQKIEDRLKSAKQEDAQKEMGAAEKWQNQHDERQMRHPTTPEKHGQAKNGIGSRLKMTLRRMTTKDAGGMEKIKEDGAPVEFKERPPSTSLEDEKKQSTLTKEGNQNDDESIKDDDVEDFVKWASRRAPPSDEEARKEESVESANKDDSRQSLDNSDVESLVGHARRKSSTKDVQENSDKAAGYSDASTASDSKESSDEEEDADDLVRWISHRDRSKAGPVRRSEQKPGLDSDADEFYDSDVPELGRWVKRYDGTSGESAATTPTKDTFAEQQQQQQKIEDEEENRGRPRSRELAEPPVQEKTHITSDDVDELVRWVSKKHLQRHDTPLSETQAPVETLASDQNDKKQAVGMSVDKESLSHSDVQDLLEHVRRKSGTADADETEKSDADGVERGDLKKMQAENPPSVGDPQLELAGKREDIRKKEKEECLGMSIDDGSLSHGDIEDLLAHVKKD